VDARALAAMHHLTVILVREGFFESLPEPGLVHGRGLSDTIYTGHKHGPRLARPLGCCRLGALPVPVDEHALKQLAEHGIPRSLDDVGEPPRTLRRLVPIFVGLVGALGEELAVRIPVDGLISVGVVGEKDLEGADGASELLVADAAEEDGERLQERVRARTKMSTGMMMKMRMRMMEEPDE
jgi:hypothetical protein